MATATDCQPSRLGQRRGGRRRGRRPLGYRRSALPRLRGRGIHHEEREERRKRGGGRLALPDAMPAALCRVAAFNAPPAGRPVDSIRVIIQSAPLTHSCFDPWIAVFVNPSHARRPRPLDHPLHECPGFRVGEVVRIRPLVGQLHEPYQVADFQGSGVWHGCTPDNLPHGPTRAFIAGLSRRCRPVTEALYLRARCGGKGGEGGREHGVENPGLSPPGCWGTCSFDFRSSTFRLWRRLGGSVALRRNAHRLLAGATP